MAYVIRRKTDVGLSEKKKFEKKAQLTWPKETYLLHFNEQFNK